MIRHILLIKFNNSATPAQIGELQKAFESISNKIEGIISVEWGINNSPEGKNNGYTHSVLMAFADNAARERYLPHPEHVALQLLFHPILDDIVVFDYQL